MARFLVEYLEQVRHLIIFQLEDILQALDSVLGVRLASAIGKGMRVKIKPGHLREMQGWVEERYGMTTVLLPQRFHIDEDVRWSQHCSGAA